MSLTQQFNNQPLKIKISFLPILLILMLVLLSINTFFDLRKIKQTTQLTSQLYAKKAKIASSILQNTLQRQTLIYQFLKSGDDNLITQFNLKVEALDAINQQLAKAGQTTDDDNKYGQKFAHISTLNHDINQVFLTELVTNQQAIITSNNQLNNDITPSIIEEIGSIADQAEIDELADTMNTANEMSAAVMNARSAMQNYILSQSSGDADRFDFEIESARSLYDDLQDTASSEDFADSMANVEKLLNQLSDKFTETRQYFDNSQQIMTTKLTPDVQQVLQTIDELQQSIWASLDSNGEAVSDNIDGINRNNLLLTLALLIFSIWILSAIVVRITQPLAEMLSTMTDMAAGEGDISQRLLVHSSDEVGQLGGEFNKFLDKLHNIILQLSNTIETLLSSSQNVSIEMNKCEQGVGVQRSETDLVSVAVNEMAATSHDASNNAASTLTTIQQAENSVSKGEKAVHSTFKDINHLAKNISLASQYTHELSEQSANVAEILTAIHGITDQTNLLALNAAIEAARAGEHGRGFAVVADAVRELATRTHESTDQIQVIIEKLQVAAAKSEQIMDESNDQAKRCVDEMSQVEQSLGLITNAFTDINDQMSQVATAMTQQTSTVEEVSRNVVKINDISADNLRSIEQSSEDSADLLKQAQSLTGIVSEFKL